jgi:ribonucleoside-diphosphate reductase alpha chain
MDCFGTALSMSLQYGVPLEVYVNKFSHTRFEPMGHTKNPDIRYAKSIVDYIFRWLGLTFLPGYREANGYREPAKTLPNALPEKSSGDGGESESETRPAATKAGGPNPGQGTASPEPQQSNGSSANGSSARPAGSNGSARPKPSPGGTAVLEAEHAPFASDLPMNVANEQFAKFQEDAPLCDNCGHITVRNGNCYLCYICGNSMGCS